MQDLGRVFDGIQEIPITGEERQGLDIWHGRVVQQLHSYGDIDLGLYLYFILLFAAGALVIFLFVFSDVELDAHFLQFYIEILIFGHAVVIFSADENDFLMGVPHQILKNLQETA